MYGRNAGDAAWNWGTAIQPNVNISNILVNAVQDAISESTLAIIGTVVLVIAAALFSVYAIILGIAWVVGESVVDWYIDTYFTDEQKQNRLYKQQRKQEAAARKREERELQELQKPRNWFDRRKIYKKVTGDETKQELENEIRSKVSEQLQVEYDKNGFGIPKAYIEQLTDDICKAVYTGL